MDLHDLAELLEKSDIKNVLQNSEDMTFLRSKNSVAYELEEKMKAKASEKLLPIINQFLNVDGFEFASEALSWGQWGLLALDPNPSPVSARPTNKRVGILDPKTGSVTQITSDARWDYTPSDLQHLGFIDEQNKLTVDLCDYVIEFVDTFERFTSYGLGQPKSLQTLHKYTLVFQEFLSRSEKHWWAVNYLVRNVPDFENIENFSSLVDFLLSNT